MNLAGRIKTVASSHGKTISQLAAEMNVAQPQLSRTINNERISLQDMVAISEAIGCEVSDFFTKQAGNEENTFSCPHCGKPIRFGKAQK